MKKQMKTEISLSELAKKLLEQPTVAPEPVIKPSEPITTPKRRNPLKVPSTAPKPAPKAEQEVIDDIVARLIKLNETESKYSLSEMLSEINQEDIEKKFVGPRTGGPDGKVVTPKEFDDIMSATSNKLALALWMIKRIQDDFILPEDIYKWEDYFEIFKRRKREFPVKDINQIKTEDQIDDFVNKAIEIIDLEAGDASKKKGVSQDDKYGELKIGEVNGFTVYKIPKGTSDEMYGVACDLGSGTSWCTATGNTKTWFDRYAKDGPLYIFIGPNGEKYQFHYESSQYMDKNDRSILGRNLTF
jgi:hypothetical protein